MLDDISETIDYLDPVILGEPYDDGLDHSEEADNLSMPEGMSMREGSFGVIPS